MQSLILVMLLVWFVLTVFLAAWTLWFQAYIYTEPAAGLLWRAPAAGTGVFLTVLLWVYLDYRAPERYSTLWEFSAEDRIEYPELIIPHRDGKEDVYKRVKRGRGSIYQRADRPLPSRPEKVIAVTANKERDTYEPDRNANGKFMSEEGRSLKYRDAAGQVMEEGQLGVVSIPNHGLLFVNLFLNFLHFVAWFLCLWLLMRFQWSHALGLAIVLWGVMIIFILPQVLQRAEDSSRQQSAPSQTAPAPQPTGQGG